MELTILGSGNGVPNARRGAAGHTIKIGREMLLFDMGPGSLQRLVETGVEIGRLRDVFFTHYHLDHVGELPSFLFVRRSPQLRRVDDITLHGPPGLADHHAALTEMWGEDVTGGDRFDVVVDELEDEPVEGPGWYVSYLTVKHADGRALAYRVEDAEGNAIVYSGDTDLCPEIIELARHADLLLLECTTPDRDKTEGHLTPTLAGRVAREANAKRLVLCHLSPACDRVDVEGAVRKEFSDGEIWIGADYMRIGIG